ncbi:MAG: hypothetical protein JWN59_134 [Sphingomonas bacterium]|nr:hypothetical protein [Sphingomonas bacterium]
MRQGGLPLSPYSAYGKRMSRTDDERAARLAEALRANLKRRKAQARETADDAPATPSPATPSPATAVPLTPSSEQP